MGEDVIGGRCPSWQAMVSVKNFHRSARARPPPADTPGESSAVTTSQVTHSIQDFAVSLSNAPCLICGWNWKCAGSAALTPRAGVATFAEQADGVTQWRQRRTPGLRPAAASRPGAGRTRQSAPGQDAGHGGVDVHAAQTGTCPPRPGGRAGHGARSERIRQRRGQSYATILVDVETRRPVGVLDGHEAQALADLCGPVTEPSSSEQGEAAETKESPVTDRTRRRHADIHRLLSEGYSQAQVCHILGLNDKTVRKSRRAATAGALLAGGTEGQPRHFQSFIPTFANVSWKTGAATQPSSTASSGSRDTAAGSGPSGAASPRSALAGHPGLPPRPPSVHDVRK